METSPKKIKNRNMDLWDVVKLKIKFKNGYSIVFSKTDFKGSGVFFFKLGTYFFAITRICLINNSWWVGYVTFDITHLS